MRTKARANVGALLTLLAIGLCSSSPSCGDCLHSAERPAIGIEFTRPNEPSAEPGPSPPPMPCSGLRCSGNETPPLSPADRARPGTDSWGLSIEPDPIDRPGPSDREVEEALVRPVRMVTSLFRPLRPPSIDPHSQARGLSRAPPAQLPRPARHEDPDQPITIHEPAPWSVTHCRGTTEGSPTDRSSEVQDIHHFD
jgi:hypothetical protein